MQLTGKCKEDFLISINKLEIVFNLYSENTQDRMIVKFFNKQGINTTFYKSKMGGCMVHFCKEFEGAKFSIQEIRQSVIFQANKKYNTTNL